MCNYFVATEKPAAIRQLNLNPKEYLSNPQAEKKETSFQLHLQDFPSTFSYDKRHIY